MNVTADALDYRGRGRHAPTYTGNAQLWQDDTSIKGASIVLDDKTGDLTATGGVTTVTVRDSVVDKNKKTERVRSIATAEDFRYEEAGRRATYTGNAHMNSPDGRHDGGEDRAVSEAVGRRGENDLERAEAYDDVTLRDQNRTTTGARLTYTTADERYVVTGAPVKVIDECRRETIGRTLTYLKSTDTITSTATNRPARRRRARASVPESTDNSRHHGGHATTRRSRRNRTGWLRPLCPPCPPW